MTPSPTLDKLIGSIIGAVGHVSLGVEPIRTIAADFARLEASRDGYARARDEMQRLLDGEREKVARLEAVITSTISEVELMKNKCLNAKTERENGFYAGLQVAADSMMIAKARIDCGEPETWLHEKIRELETQLTTLKGSTNGKP